MEVRSAAVKYGGSQLAVYHVPRRGYFATQQVTYLFSSLKQSYSLDFRRCVPTSVLLSSNMASLAMTQTPELSTSPVC